MSLLNTKTGYTTPWHCSVALLANGEWVSAPMGEFQADPRLELLYEDGRPSHFKERPQSDRSSGISAASATYVQGPTRFQGTMNGYSSPSLGSSTTAGSVISRSSTPAELSSTVTSIQSSDFRDEIHSTIKVPDKSYSNEIFSPQYGRRLIPQIMDSLATTDPDRIIFSIANVSNNNVSLREIPARAFMKAVDKTAWWLLKKVPKPTSIRPMGYIGPHDLRHILLTHACVKAGYAALFLSPKNSVEGALAVLEATKCDIWVKAGEVATVPLVTEILEQRSMTLLELPLLDELLDAEPVEPFPYTKTFGEATTDPFCFLHTSGSTGIPKPIPWSHGLIGTMDAIRLLPPTEGDSGLVPWSSDWKEGDRIYSSFPMCHVSIVSASA